MAATADAAQEPHEPELQRSLKPRHMTMIALGGIIGAGLFVGSSAVIGTGAAHWNEPAGRRKAAAGA